MVTKSNNNNRAGVKGIKKFEKNDAMRFAHVGIALVLIKRKGKMGIIIVIRD